MTSAIDITKPLYGTPTTQSVRDNFNTASNEITSLQNDVANRLLKTGDSMTGDLTLFRDPTLSGHAANRAWVINQIYSTATAVVYVGDYDASADRVLSSGQASIAVGSALPAATTGNQQYFFTVKVGSSSQIGHQPPGGCPVGAWLISNGAQWINYQPSVAGVIAQTVPVSPAITGLPGANVYDALSSVPALYLPLAGSTMTGLLTLSGNPTANNHAATKAYVDSKPAGGVTSFNTRTGAIAQQQSDIIAVGALKDYGRNRLHNGNFVVQQRGQGIWNTAGNYTADRWQIWFVNDTVSFNVGSILDSGRAAIGDEFAQATLQNTFTGNAAAGSHNLVVQRIEGMRALSGKTVTVSFWAVAPSGNPKIGVSLDQVFGTGGSPSATVNGTGQATAALTTTWTRYSLTFNVPSSAGKTFGTNFDDFTQLNIWYSSGSTYATNAGNIGVQSGSVNLWGIQLEIGNAMTPFDPGGNFQQQIAQCQRYYSTMYSWFSVNVAASSNFGYALTLPTLMRTTPTITFYSVGYSNASGIASASAGANSVIVYAVSGGAGLAAFNGWLNASADL